MLLEQLFRRVHELVGPVPQLDELTPTAVFLGVGLRVADRLIDLPVLHPLRRHDRQLLGLPGGLVLRRDAEDPVRVDVEGDLDLRHPARGGGHAGQVEAAQADVVRRHRPLSLQDVDLDARLVVRRRREDLALPGRNRRVPLDEFREDATQGLDAEAQGRHVEQEDVLHLTAEDGSLDRGSEGDALHRVDASLRGPSEDLLEPLPDDGHAGRSADQDHVPYVGELPLAVFEGLTDRSLEPFEDRLDQLLELRSGQLLLQVERLAPLLRDERQVQRRLDGARELDLRLLRGIAEPLHRLAVAGEIDAVLPLELRHEPLDQAVVHVHPAELRVARRGDDLEDALAHLHQGHVERAPTEVEDRDLPFALLVEPIGECGRRGLVHQPQDLKARDLARILRCLALVVVEIGRHGDDGLGDLLAQERLGVRLDLAQDHRGDLLGRVVLSFDADLVVCPHLPLDLHDRLFRVQHRLALRRFSHENPVLRERDHGREHLPAVRAAFRARDNLGRSPFHVACLGVGGSEVDSDDLSHWYHLDFSRR